MTRPTRRWAAGAMALAALSMLGGCSHIYEENLPDPGAAVKDYIEHLDSRPDDERVASLRAYATTFLTAMSIDMSNANALATAASDVIRRQTCLYDSYGFMAKTHIDSINRIVVGDINHNPRYITLLKAEQDVPTYRGDACNF